MQNILIVEASDQALNARGDELLLDGFEVLAARTDRQARLKLAEGSPDAVVLGTLGSGAASLALLRALRAGQIPRADPRLPVLSTSPESDHAAVRHYAAGADIVLPQSASPLLVAAGLQALAARAGLERERRRIMRVGSLEVDADARTASIDGTPVTLTRTEFDLLQTMARHPHKVFTRDELAKELWSTEFYAGRTVDSHAYRLRSKLAAAGAEPLVQNVRAIGFRLTR